MRFAQRLLLIPAVLALFSLAARDAQPQADAKKPAAKAPAQPAATQPPATKTQQKPAVKVEPAPTASDPRAAQAAEAAIRKLADEFAEAYNTANAKVVAAGYTPDGEFVDEIGQVIRGREAIEAHFAEVFKELPKARIKIVVDMVKLIAPNIAVEEGRVESRPTAEDAPETSHYIALHVRQGEQWLLARTRDFQAETAHVSAHDRLRPLEWLVGEWVDESPSALIHTNCKWADGNSYLLQEFSARLAGRPGVNGSTRIGWDPLTKQIKSWTFDSQGGHSEGLWTQVGNDWYMKSHGVTHDGIVTSATTVVKRLDKATMTWESRDRILGGEVEDNLGPITVKRRPPAPGGK